MAGPTYTIRVRREDGEVLLADGLTLARAFLAGDPSAEPGGYDSLAGAGDPDRIVVEDVVAMNTTMRARSEHAAWQPVFDDDQEWLRAIPRNLDFLETDDAAWQTADGEELLSAAIRGCIHPGIGLASATKVLYLKRPLFVPILDRFVAEVMGVNLPDAPSVAQRVQVGRQLVAALRREGRANLDVLRDIQRQLGEEFPKRSLVRIFDLILWFTHPAAGVPNAKRVLAAGISGN